MLTFTLLACLTNCYATDHALTAADCMKALDNPPLLVWVDDRLAVSSKGYAFSCVLETRATHKAAR